MDQDVFTVRIPAELYRELREYCDRIGVAFVDFVEDALEKATYRDEMELLLRDEAEMKKKIASERASSLNRGFSLGVMAATLSIQGVAALGESLTPEGAGEVLFFRQAVGEQMKLFE